MSDTPVCIKGIGFDSRTGGFAAISVDGVEFSAEYIGKCSKRVKELDVEYSLSVETGTKLANELTAVRRELAASQERVKELIDINYALEEQARALKAGQKVYKRKTFVRPKPVQVYPGGGAFPIIPVAAPTIPEGYVMVPKVLTDRMKQEAHYAVGEAGRYSNGILPEMYRAMLAAAPKPEEMK